MSPLVVELLCEVGFHDASGLVAQSKSDLAPGHNLRSSVVLWLAAIVGSVRDVDVRVLRMLVALADAGVMGQAATQLHVTQPALSKQLARVERDLGLTLFRRHRRGLTPTPSGLILVDRARAVLREHDGFIDVVRRAQREVTGTVRLGYVAQTLNERTRQILDEFVASHDGLTVRTRQYDLRDLTAGLVSGDSDIALLRQPLAASNLTHEPIFMEGRVAVLYPTHPAASRFTTEVADLFNTAWVVNATDDPAFRDYQLAVGQRAGSAALLGPKAHTIDEFLEAVVSQQAIGLAPASAAHYYQRPGVVYVPVTDAEPSVCSLSWRTDLPLSDSAAALVSFVRSRLPLTPPPFHFRLDPTAAKQPHE